MAAGEPGESDDLAGLIRIAGAFQLPRQLGGGDLTRLFAGAFKGIAVVQASVFGFAHKGYYITVCGAVVLLGNCRDSVGQLPPFSCATDKRRLQLRESAGTLIG